MLQIEEVILKSQSNISKRQLPKVIKWKGVNMIRSQSFLATVQEIMDFSSEIDVTKIGIVGDPHSGKTTLGDCIAHCIHTYAKIPYTIRHFKKEDLLNFKETLKTLAPANHILLFGDLSFMGGDATKKQIEMVKQASTQIRHIEGGRDVKIISIYDYHYLLGLDKYLRQADFKYVTTVGSSELGNLENMVGSKYVGLIKDFQKYRLKAVTKKYWKLRISNDNKKELFVYKYRNPFIPSLFYNGDTLRLIVSPTRHWIDSVCSVCSEASGELQESDIPIDKFAEQGETNFGKGNFEAAIKLNLYVNGLTTYGKHVVQALRWIDKARQKKKISLEQLATHYGLSVTTTRLRKKLDGVLDYPETAIMPVEIVGDSLDSHIPNNPYLEYTGWSYEALFTEIEKMSKLPESELDIPRYEYLNKKAKEMGDLE